jgi:hypothetical protein
LGVRGIFPRSNFFDVLARYEHLPIYRSALDMTVHFERLVAGSSRYQKHTLGTEFREASRGVLVQVVRANNAPSGLVRRAAQQDRQRIL